MMKPMLFIACLLFLGANIQAQKNKPDKNFEQLSEMDKIKKILTDLEMKFEEKKFAEYSYLECTSVYQSATENIDVKMLISINSYQSMKILKISTMLWQYELDTSNSDDEAYKKNQSYNLRAPEFLRNSPAYKIGSLEAMMDMSDPSLINLTYTIKIPFTAQKEQIKELLDISTKAKTEFKPY